MNKQTAAFIASYNNLNAEQKKAVDTIEGPVMVNAGPGTGKTQILATRIGNILMQTDCLPNNILCLTYTDNGAVEMRNRLLKIIGTDAYAINIHTFHSFCNEVIQDNLHYFGKLSVEPISDLEEIDLFNTLIDGIDANSALKRFSGNIYFEKPRLQHLFSLMKKEAFTEAYLLEKIDAFIQELPTKEGYYYKKKYKEFNAGDPKKAKIEETTQKMEQLKAAIQLFATYNTLMKEMGRYNFDDMILWVLQAFENNPNLLLNYQEKYLYVLVDEFQDTSRSQNLLLQHLISYWNEPNVFVVGDADQSIFSFQDANVENMVAFEKKFQTQLTKVNLVNNYRSTQPILNAAHQLIINNQIRTVDIAADAPLTAANTLLQNITTAPTIVEYANTTQEAMHIALQIEQLIQQGISGKEIAVIYRNHAQVQSIATILEQKNIPVNTKKKVNVLHEPLVQNILSILQWIDKEWYLPFSADDVLFKILHGPWFGIQPIDIAGLSIEANGNKISLRKALAKQIPAQANLFDEPKNPLYKASNILENLLQQVTQVTVQELVSNVLQQTGILFSIMNKADTAWQLQILNTFFNAIKDVCKKQPTITLHELLRNIALMQQHNISIPLNKITATDNGVNLITAHSSKGSEYAHVFVIGCTTAIWDDSKKLANRTYMFPDNLVNTTLHGSELEESRRLFYVAITRAKTNLQVSYALQGTDGKELTKSSFVTEMATAPNVVCKQETVNEQLMPAFITAQLLETAKPTIQLMNDGYINELLKKYTLSVTHLNNYLNCPLKFYYTNLVKVPSPKNENMVFGSAVHYALERLFKVMKENSNEFPSVHFFLDQFNWYMQNNKEAFTAESFTLKLAYGDKILPAYYQQYISSWNKISIVEYPLRNIHYKGIPLNGKLDKLEFNGKQVQVVDYKTGKYTNAKEKLLPPNPKEPNGGDYWRQAVFYKILLDSAKTDWQNQATIFEFVEPVNNEYKNALVSISQEDITTVGQQIETVWQQIQAKQFNKGCGKKDCSWCNFVKNNQLSTALYAADDDALLEV